MWRLTKLKSIDGIVHGEAICPLCGHLIDFDTSIDLEEIIKASECSKIRFDLEFECDKCFYEEMIKVELESSIEIDLVFPVKEVNTDNEILRERSDKAQQTLWND